MTFLRSDRVFDDKKPAFSVLISQLESHLQSKNVSHGSLTQLIKELPSDSVKSNALQSFLVVGSLLTEIPQGRKGRKSKDAVYTRCVQIKKDIFSNEAITALDSGKYGISCLRVSMNNEHFGITIQLLL